MTESEINKEAAKFFPPQRYPFGLAFSQDDVVAFAQHSVEKANGWRPIADAPKDGSTILIYSPNASRAVREVSWSIPYEGATDGWWATPHGPQGRGYTILPESPTHWKPLPPPPEAA